MRWWMVLFIIVVLVLLTCARIAKTDTLGDILKTKQEDNGFLSQILKAAPLVINDRLIGKFFADSIENQVGLDQNPQRKERVQKIGQRILSLNKISGKYDFAVLSSHDFNACSIFGGHIRVNEGLLFDTQNNDAEAAFAIAHEIAHNTLGHNKEAVDTFRISYALDLSGISKKMPKLIKSAANAVLAKRSRDHESAADFRALQYMAKTGYKITGAIAMTRRIEAERKIALKKMGQQSLLAQRFNAIFDTHPEPAKRAKMTESFYLQQKYGSTFETTSSVLTDNDPYSRSSIFGDRAIVVAHPSLWNSPLSAIHKICAVGIFNPAPQESEEKDVHFYINVLRHGNLVAAICDNDSHDLVLGRGEGTAGHFTYIKSDGLDPRSLVEAIKLGRTYASADDTEIKDMNFLIGTDYPNVKRINFTFRLVFNKKHLPVDAPVVLVYKDGEQWKTFKSNSRGNLKNGASYAVNDDDPGDGHHWYVIYVKRMIITSPITVTVTNDSNNKSNSDGSSNWRKGIIHYHSFYSDGNTRSIQKIWDKGQENGLNFIFMTDHADCFGSNVNHGKKLTHHHKNNNPYDRLANDCSVASPAMISGIEYPLYDVNDNNHLLVLNLDPKDFLPYQQMDEKTFFGNQENYPARVRIIKDQFHLGDDHSQDEMIKDTTFNFAKADATLKMWIKGSPFKDPIIWINRREVGRVVTTDDKWHLFTFHVPAGYLNNGRNLFYIESFIPDRFHTFDDCEIKDVWISKN